MDLNTPPSMAPTRSLQDFSSEAIPPPINTLPISLGDVSNASPDLFYNPGNLTTSAASSAADRLANSPSLAFMSTKSPSLFSSGSLSRSLPRSTGSNSPRPSPISQNASGQPFPTYGSNQLVPVISGPPLGSPVSLPSDDGQQSVASRTSTPPNLESSTITAPTSNGVVDPLAVGFMAATVGLTRPTSETATSNILSQAELPRSDTDPLTKVGNPAALGFVPEEEVEQLFVPPPGPPTDSAIKRGWIRFVKFGTFYIPDAFIKLSWVKGKDAGEDALFAWREKYTAFCIIVGWYLFVLVVFLILPVIFCTPGPGDQIGILSKDTVPCMVYDILVLTYTIIGFIIIFFTLWAAFRIRWQTWKVSEDKSDKLVILHIPCYSEDESCLRKTIDSVVACNYPDSGKLLWVIADGIVTGAGADMSTADILIDRIFQCRDQEGYVEPDAREYVAAGHNGCNMNRARAYCGYYEVDGHVAPFILTVKCGMPDERSAVKPGNRGKRDSQLIIFNMLYRYNFAPEEMQPLDFEHAQCFRDLGLDASQPEYLLLADADTYIRPGSLDLQVNQLDKNPHYIGCCGETKVDNRLATLTSNMQVFEYFITHVVLKAFEGFYSKVLVLSGCFAVYRLKFRDPETKEETPAILSPAITEKYMGNMHKDLHEHNLLTIGEDRYLSTLIIRTFPEYDTVYVPAAVCTTSVPESLSVLMDQRRRWTNSLIHCHVDHMIHPPKFPKTRQTLSFFTVIFLELWMVFMLPELIACGFFFLFITIARGMSTVSLILTLVFLCIPIFVATFTGRWRQYLYWFTFFCGIPVFSIAIPIWSFWQMDNIRWGATRPVTSTDATLALILEDDQEKQVSLLGDEAMPVQDGPDMHEMQTIQTLSQ